MANIYTVELTDSEQKAMEHIAADVNEWIQNVVHERARLASEQMVGQYVEAQMAAGKPLSGTRDEIIKKSKLPNAKERHKASLKEVKP